MSSAAKCQHCGRDARQPCTNPGGHRFELISFEDDIHPPEVIRGLQRLVAKLGMAKP